MSEIQLYQSKVIKPEDQEPIQFQELECLLKEGNSRIISFTSKNIGIYVNFNGDYAQTYRFHIQGNYDFRLPAVLIRQSKTKPKKFFIDLKSVKMDILGLLKTILSDENAQSIYEKILASFSSEESIFDINANIHFYDNQIFNLTYEELKDDSRKQHTSKIVASSLSDLLDKGMLTRLSEIGKSYVNFEKIE